MWHTAQRGAGAPPVVVKPKPASGWRLFHAISAALLLLAVAGGPPAAAAPPASRADAAAGRDCVAATLRPDICLRARTAAPATALIERLRTAQACRPPPRCRQDQRPCNIRRDRNTGCITWQCCPR